VNLVDPSPDELAALWRLALHESAHAVVAHRLGIRIDFVTLVNERGDKWAPCVHPSPEPIRWDADVTVALAGHAVDGGRDWRTSDEAQVFEFAADPARYWPLARWLVRRYRDRIERVADALVRSGRLSGDVVAALA
jgi:hypothetical protein